MELLSTTLNLEEVKQNHSDQSTFSHTNVDTWLFEGARAWNHVDAITLEAQPTLSRVAPESIQSTGNNRRRMTTPERIYYIEVRKVGACQKCRKGKRKCNHVAVDCYTDDIGGDDIQGSSSQRLAPSPSQDDTTNKEATADHASANSISSNSDRGTKRNYCAAQSRVVSIHPYGSPLTEQPQSGVDPGFQDTPYEDEFDERTRILDGYTGRYQSCRTLSLDEICQLNQKSYEAQLRESEERMLRYP